MPKSRASGAVGDVARSSSLDRMSLENEPSVRDKPPPPGFSDSTKVMDWS